MAVTKQTTDTPDGLGRHLELYTQAVAATNVNTVASDAVGIRRLLRAHAKFTGSVTAETLVVSIISGIAPSYDVELISDPIASETSGSYIPTEEIWLADGDIAEAVASADAGEGSSVSLYMHVYGAPIRS